MPSTMDYIDSLLKTTNRPMTYYPDQIVCGPTGDCVYGSFKKEPGLCGLFHFIHKTDLPDLLTLDFGDIANAVKLKTEYEWMPSHVIMRHYYPNFEMKEYKYITKNDMVVSHIEVRSKSGPVEFRIAANSKLLNQNFETVFQTKFGQKVFLKALCSDQQIFAGKTVKLDIQRSFQFSIACSFTKPGEEVPDRIPTLEEHREEYGSFFNQIPRLSCSDKNLERVYYYRWYLLRHHIAQPKTGNIQHPIFYEGRNGYFGTLGDDDETGWEFSRGVLASAPLQLFDMRWHWNSAYAQGEILNFTENFGRMEPFLFYTYHLPLLPGCIRVHDFTGHYFFHLIPYAAWLIYQTNQDLQWLKDVTPALWNDLQSWSKYDDGSSLPEMVYEGDSAMEFGPASHCYRKTDQAENGNDLTIGTAIHYEAGDASWGKPFSTRRTEVAAFYGMNYLAFYHIYLTLQEEDKANLCLEKYRSVQKAVLGKMWSKKSFYFHELRKNCNQIEEVKQIGGLFCLLLVNPLNSEGFLKNLTDSKKFNQKFGIPSVSKDSFGYFPNNSLAGKVPHTCLWNGPSWPYSTSYALLAVADYLKRISDKKLKEKYSGYFKEEFYKYTNQHFLARGDRTPCIVEHYNPETGEPLSGQDDYNHSCYIDLIIRAVSGFDPDLEGNIRFSPINMGIKRLKLEDIPYKGHFYTVEIDQIHAKLFRGAEQIAEVSFED